MFFCILAAVVGVFLSWTRNQRISALSRLESEVRARQSAEDRSGYQSALDKLRNKHNRELEQIEVHKLALIEELAMSVFMVSGGLGELSETGIKHRMEIAQNSILVTVRNRLGPVNGVRACIFVKDETVDHDQLIGWQFGEHGRLGPSSKRKFTADDQTFQMAIQKIERYVEDVSMLKGNERMMKPYRYQTFATYPISDDERLFGILTIDAPEVGDISQYDRTLLGFYASILALTFIVQKDVPSIDRTGYVEMWNNGQYENQTKGDE